ncbi:pilus assembly protein TadG-related protein [Streptomyces sp. NPDC127190]|uniref:pilus assembly protein TadG-related protein n=1 Tax=unclassified Streptomyces TaxID=2593676 RepID=UPI003633AE84
MCRRRRSDSGQAFPIYLTVVAGLLFLALAYLAIGQASVNRSGAQTAADAAALAAAQDQRDQLTGKWLENLKDPAKWQDIFAGKADLTSSCWRADELAAQNDGQVQRCDESQPLKVTVDVRTNKPVGDSVVPGVKDIRSTESATAVVELRCKVNPPDLETGDSPLPRLTCDGKVWNPDPGRPEELPQPQDLFDVHLAD